MSLNLAPAPGSSPGSGTDALFEQLLCQADKTYNGSADADLTWEEWLAKVAPHIRRDLMAPQHVELWEWIDALEPGIRPAAFLADWPRAFGKTTTMRLAMARMCVTMKRRFGLYTCSTQESANNHIVSIRQRFEDMGVARLESKYGHALGWSGERLRTDNGFTILALGLDTAALRGLNLNDLRPDFIALDDIDDLNDSVEACEKKYRTLTQTVLPAGSSDMAVMFGQNEIHGGSVMHRFVSGDADALRRRKISKVVAVRGFECATVPTETPGEPDPYVITAGESTWPGKTLAQWTEDLNLYGEPAFRRECQHELGAGGLFFRFMPTVRDDRTGEMLPWHICPMPKVEAWHDKWASHDYGTTAPACSHVAMSDEWGVVTVIGEEYRADRTSKQQALALMLLAWELGIGSKPPAYRDESVPGGIVATDTDGAEQSVETQLERIAFDYANTFPPNGATGDSAIQRQGEYPVEVWWRYGLPAVMAVKDIIAGLRNAINWLGRTVTYPAHHPTQPGVTVPAFRIAEGKANMLVGYFEKALKHPKDERLAVAPSKYEHAGDSGARYLLSTRPDASLNPNDLPGGYSAQGMRDVSTGQMKPAIVTRQAARQASAEDTFGSWGADEKDFTA